MQADLNWFAVLAHHAIRTPDQAAHRLRGARRRTGRWRRTPLRSPPGCTSAGSARATWSACSPTTVPSSSRPSSPPTTSARSRCRSTGGWRRRRCATSSSIRRPARSSATRHSSSSATQATAGLGRRPGARLHVGAGSERMDGAGRRCAPLAAPPRPRVAADDVHRLMYTSGTTGRPKGVMLTHANLAWKNLAHLVEFGFTSADLGLACGPLYHVGALDLTTTSLIAAGATTIIHRGFDAARGGRRTRTFAGHRRLAGTGDGQRHHGVARHRGARPVLGPPGHQRRREDAGSADRADPADVLRPPGSPTRTASPRPCPATRSSTATAS